MKKIIANAVNILTLVLGSICLLYYFLCGFLAGFGTSALWIWLLAGLICFLRYFISSKIRKKKIKLKRESEKLINVIGAAAAVLVLMFLVVEGCIISGMNQQGPDGLEYIIVLGAGVNGKTPSNALKLRIDKAFEYLNENEETQAIVSGGLGSEEQISEAECMAGELIAKGIAGDRITLEDKSTSTAENMKYSYQLMERENASVGIVTNNFHVFRAVQIAKKIGFTNVYGISAPYTLLFTPHYMVREFLTFTIDTIRGNT